MKRGIRLNDFRDGRPQSAEDRTRIENLSAIHGILFALRGFCRSVKVGELSDKEDSFLREAPERQLSESSDAKISCSFDAHLRRMVVL
jgi:hypothetical protein